MRQTHSASSKLRRPVRTIRKASLRPLFTTEIRRSKRQLHPDRCTTVEAVFANGAPVTEMELELKSGDVQALFALALDLLASVPLAIETASKAERSFRLLTGGAPEASKAAPIRIDAQASAEDAFKRIVGATLTHLLSNVGAAERGDVEGVHQIRVAVRRLRAALAMFKQYLDPVMLGHFTGELRRVGTLLGRARDWDVYALETLGAVETSIPDPAHLAALRSAAEEDLMAAHLAVSGELVRRPIEHSRDRSSAALRPICSIECGKWQRVGSMGKRRPVRSCTPYVKLLRNCCTG